MSVVDDRVTQDTSDETIGCFDEYASSRHELYPDGPPVENAWAALTHVSEVSGHSSTRGGRPRRDRGAGDQQDVGDGHVQDLTSSSRPPAAQKVLG